MMISSDYDWIRLGIVFFCFASFRTEARIDYNSAGGNNIFGQNIVKDANVPASTFLLDWDQLKSASTTRDELFRMQRHTYMLSPINYQYYNGAGKKHFQHQFNLFNPFTPKPTKATPKPITIVPNSIPSASFASTPLPLPPIPNNKVTENKINSQKLQLQKKIMKAPKTKSLEKLPRTIEPFFPSLHESKPEVRSDTPSRPSLNKQQWTPVRSSAIEEINNNLLSRFKVYQAVPGDDF